ncbi:MAG: pilus assembly protein PilM [bacterium]
MSRNIFSSFLTPPSFLTIPTVSFEAGDLTIRYLEIIQKGDKIKIGRYGSKEIAAGAIVGGEIVKEDDIILALKQIQAENNFSFVQSVLPEDECYLFNTQIPGGVKKPEEIRQSIEFHLEENVPMPVAETVFGFEEVGCSEDSSVKTVNVFAAPRTLVDKYISMFAAAGMTLVGFDIESRAVARAVVPGGDMKPYMIINIRDTGTTISVVDRGLVLFSSTSNVGANSIDEAIRRNKNITAAEARKIKEKALNKIADADSVEIFSALINFASAIKDETDRFYAYWLSHRETNRHDDVERVYLVGKSSLITGFEKYLYMAMNKDVDPANVWINVLDLNKELPEMTFEDSLDYAAVIGLYLPFK